MNNPKVSVVIPVYKVENYLRRCVDSVLRQTLSDIEIILVDDGSPDNCSSICDDYCSKNSCVKVIHKANGGLSSARNAGMKVATGKYLFFLDSDDWIDDDGLERLYSCAEKYQVDFVRYRLYRSMWPGLPKEAPCRFEQARELNGGYYNYHDIVEKVYPRLITTAQMTMGAIVGATGSLYNLNFLKQNDLMFYEEVKFSEDIIFSARVVRAARSFYYIDEACVYHYFYNPESISKSFRKDRWESCKELIKFCYQDFLQDEAYDFSDQLHILNWFCVLLSLGERRYLDKYEDRLSYCRQILMDQDAPKYILDFKKIKVSWKLKILMIMVKLKMSWLIAGM